MLISFLPFKNKILFDSTYKYAYTHEEKYTNLIKHLQSIVYIIHREDHKTNINYIMKGFTSCLYMHTTNIVHGRNVCI